MADYYSQTVIRPDIPRSAMTGLEFAALCQVFSHEKVGEDIYFYAEHGPNDFILLGTDVAAALLVEDDGIASMLAGHVGEQLAALASGEEQLEVDMSVIGFEGIFQDVVKRSALDYVEVEAAWACSKMRPDGFGGAASLITADAVDSVSTAGWLGEMISQLALGSAPP